MRILKIGGFDKEGLLTGWHLGVELHDKSFDGDVLSGPDGLFVAENGSVRVHGVEIVEWTEARKKAMEG